MAAKPDLDSLLDCPICLTGCEDPRVLTCLHSSCLKCLERHIRTSAEGSHFLCPSCHHKCEVPVGGVTSLPKNIFVNSLKAITRRPGLQETTASSTQFSTSQTGQQECSNNGSSKTKCGKASVFCVECAQFYCSDCLAHHASFRDFSAHQLLPLSSSDPKMTDSSRCKQHSKLPTDMYCNTCQVLVCVKCCLLGHKHHDYCEIEEATRDSNLLSNLTKTGEHIVNKLDQHMSQLEVSEKKIIANCGEACRQFRDNAERIRALVTQRESFVIQQAQSKALDQLKAAYKEAETSKAAVESLLAQMKALQLSSTIANQSVYGPYLQEQLRQYEDAPLQSVNLELSLKRQVQNLSALDAVFGSVSVRQTIASGKSLADTVAISEETKAQLASPLLDLKPDLENVVSGLVMMGDFVCVTGFNKPHLWIYSTSAKNDKRHTLDGLGAAGMTPA